MTSLRIAMIGQRGVPATFGGIEHHVEELGSRLVARGHEVVVFCRANYVDDPKERHRGMHLRHLSTVGTKHLDAIVHSGVSTLAAMAGRFDILHYHALGPGLVSPLPRYLSRASVVQTIHGLDDERAKWGRGAKAALRAAQWLSARVPDATITVSRALADHYARRHGCAAVYIPNGVTPGTAQPPDGIAARFGLARGGYVLFVGRLVPEKAPDILLSAFRRLDAGVRLVIAGGSSFTDAFVDSLQARAAADERVLLTGYVYGRVLEELYANAAVFVLPSHLEGLPLTLLEAASYATPIVASSIPPHLEVLGQDGPGRRLVPPGDEQALADAIAAALQDPDRERAGAVELREEVLAGYDWDAAAEATEAVYRRVARPRRARARAGAPA
ncbi:MAG: glycosyltransferase family 4 protein [Actinomycetota bacterium]